jgi:hypothetical protein
MTAPAAPTIFAVSNGERILVRWRPVATAESYTLYLQEAGGARGVEDTIDDSEIGADGWLVTWTRPNAGVITVDVTATNLGAEESAASNAIQRNLTGGSTQTPTDALRHTMKGAQHPA